MKIIEKPNLIERFINLIPGLFIIGLGTLEINFPHAMDGFDDGYTGTGRSGFILLLFELLLMVTWGQIAGIILILLGIILILFGLFPSSSNKEETEETSETEESNSESEEKSGRKFRRLGKTARSLAKKYLDDNKQ